MYGTLRYVYIRYEMVYFSNNVSRLRETIAL